VRTAGLVGGADSALSRIGSHVSPTFPELCLMAPGGVGEIERPTCS